MSDKSNLFENLQLLNESERLVEIANISSSITNLPYNIWSDAKGYTRKLKHNSRRLKIEGDRGEVEVSLSPNPEVLAGDPTKLPKLSKMLKFISAHYDLFEKHFQGKIEDDVFLMAMRLVSRNKVKTDEEAEEKAIEILKNV